MSERRMLRTAEECLAAGWADGEGDEPLTQQEIERLVLLHSPYLRAGAEAAS